MATYEIGFKPTVAPTDSSAAITRTFSHTQTDLTANGSTIAPRHLVSAGQKITGAYYYIRASTGGVAGTVTAGAYVANSGTNAAEARVATWSHGTSSSTPGWNFVALDVDLNSYSGQYIKPAGGYSVNNRPYYVTGTSGHGAYVSSDLPNPYGSPINTTQIHTMYFVVEDVAAPIITDVNSNETVAVGSADNVATVANYTANPTAVTVGGKACTGISYAANEVTFDMPGYVDGQTYPEPDANHDLIISNVTPETDTITVNLTPAAGRDVVTIASAISNDSTYIGAHFTLADGDKLDYDTESATFSISTVGGITCESAGAREIWHWKAADDIMTLINLTLNDAGDVLSVAITARSITATSITATSITARSL